EGNSGTKNLTFTITRGGSTAVAGSVQYFTQAITGGVAATPTADYTTKAPTSMSFPVGVTSKTFTVTIKGDYVAESDEYFQVGLKNAVNGDLPSFPYNYGQIVNDDSSATPSISIGDVAITEGDSLSKNVTFTVTRSGNLAGTTAFKYATQNGTAVAPGDYAAKALTSLSFTAGQTSKTITVSIKGDTIAELDEEFSVVLSAVTGGTIADGTGTARIVNDD
ncbi:MAG TPA: Calx-beta domain-containing protein, partial [Nocardioides sp.]|nr:Calx-beta domain-containing protein [Nocardioides sp.]